MPEPSGAVAAGIASIDGSTWTAEPIVTSAPLAAFAFEATAGHDGYVIKPDLVSTR